MGYVRPVLFSEGYVVVTRRLGAPVRVHWSLPLGLIVLGRFAISPVAWLLALVIVILHEVGHAVLARRFGCSVLSLDLHALGGACRWTGAVSPWQRALIAWGGVLAQLVLLVALESAAWATGPLGLARWPLVVWLAQTNVLIMLLNLLPVRPFDGREAWPLFKPMNLLGVARALGRTLRRRRDSGAPRPRPNDWS
jgi:stage IV sporulation protein FB